ncbi:RpiB/LacA/LacB family sugar-phosphate isomerase [Sporohalobacter salinus]|uniref:RpiB/LacA/LacB family sugar-phosphate isomerase n=1 Tax=Sporohalobacter salinus TaxID=1494606 RepID=UPI001960EB92|nr:RpiB/LacA/LacB family sugar-phosphate isomerase [Sporohalobacter salinus]MBM7623377.1 ribose 5-phosphate isomerase B [Sporohalobacter salinus]
MSVIKDKEYVIGCDRAGVELKRIIKDLLDKEGVEYEDVGVDSEDISIVYPKIAKRVVDQIKKSDYEKEGILICGTGIGMAISANKFSGIYAARCHDCYSAERARLSNDTNVITMGSRVIGSVLAQKVVQEWLSLEFQSTERSMPKINKIKSYEKENFTK